MEIINKRHEPSIHQNRVTSNHNQLQLLTFYYICRCFCVCLFNCPNWVFTEFTCYTHLLWYEFDRFCSFSLIKINSLALWLSFLSNKAWVKKTDKTYFSCLHMGSITSLVYGRRYKHISIRLEITFLFIVGLCVWFFAIVSLFECSSSKWMEIVFCLCIWSPY